MAYDVLQYLHVVSAIIWIGGVATLTVLQLRFARGSRDGQVALAQASESLGRTVIGPAAGITLIAGIATAAAGSLDMSQLWLVWGFAGIVVSAALGATVIRRATSAYASALSAPAAAPDHLGRLRSRMTRLNLLNLLVLLSAEAAMVIKPTL